MVYKAPVADIAFALNHIAGFSRLVQDGMFGDLDQDTAGAILEEAGRFATEKLAPINRVGDEHPARLDGKDVVTSPGWKEAYVQFAESGWNGLAGPTEFGGQGLPQGLAMAVGEMWNGANMAFALCPLLTQGAVEAIDQNGAADLKAKYLPKMISGEWTGSMQLTEPGAGSDLRFLKTRAIPQGNGSYKVTGTKIFITYGEHSLTSNIIHLVLARLPDAPPGTKGISLFVVPKYLVNDDGSLGARNDVFCSKLEHKLGIHGSPTCVMNFGDEGGALAWIVGEPHRGLQYMFTMMNRARLGVGVQGVGVAEHAYQHALAYAKERRQGSVDGTPDAEMTPIINHPDVRRMLLSMKAKIAAARALCAATAVAIDVAKFGSDEVTRARADAEAALLTPLAKSYGSDIGVEIASEGIQIHGGMGFVEEAGAAQFYRDARITPIYEGTNGIQCIDLVGRKLTMNNGETLKSFLEGLHATIVQLQTLNEPVFGDTAEALTQGIVHLAETTEWLIRKLFSDPKVALAGATSFGRLFSVVAGGTLLARGALSAMHAGDGAAEGAILLSRHFAETQVPAAASLKFAVFRSANTIFGTTADNLLA
jgi:acyl-CoA dehydrogenase